MRPLLLLSLLFSSALFAQNQAPVVSNLSAEFNYFNNRLTVRFDVSDAENDSLDVWILLSDDSGLSFRADISSATGDLGFPLLSGTGKEIRWNAPGPINFSTHRVKIVADDRQVIDIQTLVDQVDSSRLKQDLQFVAQERHAVTALPHLKAVKDTLEARFEMAALQTSRQSKNLGGYVLENILGRKPGLRNEAQTYLVDAHFDGVAGTAAADDNASGTVGMLECARILSQYEFAHSLRFIGFDQEEAGLLGSIEYVINGIPAEENLAGVLNFEMIGYYDEAANTQDLPPGFDIVFPSLYNSVAADSFRGNFLINVANAASNPLRTTFDSCAAAYVPELITYSLAAPGNAELVPDLRRSDHAPFWDGGYQALMLTDGADFRNQNYHTPGDSIYTLNLDFMHQVVKTAVASLATLARPLHAGTASSEVVGLTNGLPAELEACGLKWIQQADQLTFTINQNSCGTQSMQLRLLDLHGREIRHQRWEAGQSQAALSIANLSSGIYLWVLESSYGLAAEKILIR